MDTFDLLVVNGLVVTASDIAHYDIAVTDGKIALLAPRGMLLKTKARKVIDAQGGYVTPGGIDTHVHLEEPVLIGEKGISSDNFETGSTCSWDLGSNAI